MMMMYQLNVVYRTACAVRFKVACGVADDQRYEFQQMRRLLGGRVQIQLRYLRS